MDENANLVNKTKPKSVTRYYIIGFGIWIFISYLYGENYGQVGDLIFILPIGLGLLGGAIVSFIFQVKSKLSLVVFSMITILTYFLFGAGGGFQN